MAKEKGGCALDVLVEANPELAEGLTPHEDMTIFINICKGVHGVGGCEECFNFKGGACGFLHAAGLSCKHGEKAEA